MRPSALLRRRSFIRVRPLRRLITRTHPPVNRPVLASIAADALSFNRRRPSWIFQSFTSARTQSMIANPVPYHLAFVQRSIHRPSRRFPFKFVVLLSTSWSVLYISSQFQWNMASVPRVSSVLTKNEWKSERNHFRIFQQLTKANLAPCRLGLGLDYSGFKLFITVYNCLNPNLVWSLVWALNWELMEREHAGTISYYTTFSFIFQHSKESLVKAHFVNLIHSLPSSSSMLSTLQSFDTYSMYTLSSIKTNQIQKKTKKKQFTNVLRMRILLDFHAR